VTTAAFNRINPHAIAAINAVKTQHCPAPTYAPAAPVSAQMKCPKCRSPLNYTVSTSGMSSGQCVAPSCVRWALQ